MTDALYLKCGGGLTAAMDDLDEAFQQSIGQNATATDEQGERWFVPQVGKTCLSWIYDPDLVTVRAVYDTDGETILEPAITKGPHLRVQARPHGVPDQQHFDLMEGLRAWVMSWPWANIDLTQEMLDRLGIAASDVESYVHTTSRDTYPVVREDRDDAGNVVGYITVPKHPKGGWQ